MRFILSAPKCALYAYIPIPSSLQVQLCRAHIWMHISIEQPNMPTAAADTLSSDPLSGRDIPEIMHDECCVVSTSSRKFLPTASIFPEKRWGFHHLMKFGLWKSCPRGKVFWGFLRGVGVYKPKLVIALLAWLQSPLHWAWCFHYYPHRQPVHQCQQDIIVEMVMESLVGKGMCPLINKPLVWMARAFMSLTGFAAYYTVCPRLNIRNANFSCFFLRVQLHRNCYVALLTGYLRSDLRCSCLGEVPAGIAKYFYTFFKVHSCKNVLCNFSMLLFKKSMMLLMYRWNTHFYLSNINYF